MTNQHDAPEGGAAQPVAWRVGRHYKIHVYRDDVPVATFHDPDDAVRAVEAVNGISPSPAPSGLADAVQAYLAAVDAYDKLGYAGKSNVVSIDAGNRKNAARLALDAALTVSPKPKDNDPMRVVIQNALRLWHEKLGYPAAQEGEIHIGADIVLAAMSAQTAPAEPILWRGVPIAEAQKTREYWLEAYPDGNFPEGI